MYTRGSSLKVSVIPYVCNYIQIRAVTICLKANHQNISASVITFPYLNRDQHYFMYKYWSKYSVPSVGSTSYS